MKSADFLPTITQQFDYEHAYLLKAEALREQLLQDYGQRLQRLAVGVALTTECPVWSTHVSSAAFYAGWRESKYHASITVYLTLEQIPSWSTMIPVFDALSARGFDADKWTSRDDAASYSRVYSYQVRESDNKEILGNVEFVITASLPGDTDTCKRIITGYSTPSSEPSQPQPIYKLVCEGEGNAAEDQ